MTMAITASQVKELREITGLGMMECKKALVEADGDQDAAIDLLRKKAGAKVEKKSSRTAADGVISIFVDSKGKNAAMVEVNSETDFVAKGDEFQNFANQVAQTILEQNPENVAALAEMTISGGSGTVAKTLEGLVSKLGENMNIRRFTKLETDGKFGSYIHGRNIGVLVEIEGGDDELAHDLSLHIAASRPEYVTGDEVPAEILDKEKEIFTANAKESGKPDEIIEKMVAGRIAKFVNEITLLGQPFVKDPDMKVEKLLKQKNATVKNFIRYQVGEGIEKKQEDFASEVMAQVKGG
jgi:elongation factor Ts